MTADDMSVKVRGRAVGYVRVYERGRDRYGELATHQIDLITGWALEHGADVLDWFFDLGVDAAEPLQRRSAGIRLLDRVRCGDLNFVVVASLDVLGKAEVLLDALRLVLDAGADLGVVAVLPSPREEPDPHGTRRVELGPTAPLEPQLGTEALN